MRILNLLIALVAMLTVGCVGLHLYIVEDEMNEIRQARKFNVELRTANLTSQDALAFARDTQYIALMAEERATELAYKLNVAASMVKTLEEHLKNALLTVETQATEIQDLIDQNSELQNNNQWMMEENERLKAQIEIIKADLEAALVALDEKAIELDETNIELEAMVLELKIVREELQNLQDNLIYPPKSDEVNLIEVEVS